METCCDYLDHETMYVSTDEAKLKEKILQFQHEYPTLVHILKQPEENDGTLYCTMPPNWLKIQPPRKMNLTEEQREAIKRRLHPELYAASDKV